MSDDIPTTMTLNQFKLYCLISGDKAPLAPCEYNYYLIGGVQYIFIKQVFMVVPDNTLVK